MLIAFGMPAKFVICRIDHNMYFKSIAVMLWQPWTQRLSKPCYFIHVCDIFHSVIYEKCCVLFWLLRLYYQGGGGGGLLTWFNFNFGVLPQDLVMYRSCETFAIVQTLKFDRHLDSSSAKMSCQFQNDTIILASNPLASRLVVSRPSA